MLFPPQSRWLKEAVGSASGAPPEAGSQQQAPLPWAPSVPAGVLLLPLPPPCPSQRCSLTLPLCAWPREGSPPPVPGSSPADQGQQARGCHGDHPQPWQQPPAGGHPWEGNPPPQPPRGGGQGWRLRGSRSPGEAGVVQEALWGVASSPQERHSPLPLCPAGFWGRGEPGSKQARDWCWGGGGWPSTANGAGEAEAGGSG